jgi:hypothetical protein
MTMEVPFVPTTLQIFDEVNTTCNTESATEQITSFVQSTGSAHSYLDSTTASRYASIDPSKDLSVPQQQALPSVYDGDKAERKRQFYANTAFEGDERLFENF